MSTKKQSKHIPNLTCTCDGTGVVTDMSDPARVKKINGKKSTYGKDVPCPECKPEEYEKATGEQL